MFFTMSARQWFFGWHCGLVVDTWLRDRKILGSSPGCARLTLSPWERLFPCNSSPHLCVKRVHDCRQYGSVTRHLYWQLLCNALKGVEKGTMVRMACRGPHVKRYRNALFNLIYIQDVLLSNDTPAILEEKK